MSKEKLIFFITNSDSTLQKYMKFAFIVTCSVFLDSECITDNVCSENTTENVIVKSGKDNLSDFQKDKFCHFFSHVLDQDSDQVICKGIY